MSCPKDKFSCVFVGFTAQKYGELFIFSEQPISNYLKVLCVNPNPFVIIDFDAANAGSEKFKRGLRLANELNKNNKNQNGSALSFLNPQENDLTTKSETDCIKNFWWSKARELENYCPPDLLKDFYEQYNQKSKSNVSGCERVSDWNVYNPSDGVGSILENRGMENVKEKSGTIKHKNELALFVSKNMKPKHLEVSPSYPNGEQLEDLKNNLNKIIDYISCINHF